MFGSVLQKIRESRPLVHAITNYVTINDCANIMLAAGGSPIMADAPQESAQITAACDGLVLNLGMLNDSKKEAMRTSAAVAAECGKPVILDPVGVGASPYRLETAAELLNSMAVSVIRGNASEISALARGHAQSRGVDAVLQGEPQTQLRRMKELSRKYSAIVVQTGETDLLTDGETVYEIHNGDPMMKLVTGSGCMLSALTGVCCAADPEHLLEACACAVCMMGLAGELSGAETAARGGGTASFRGGLIDWVSKMNEEILNGGMKLEMRSDDDAAVCGN